MIESTPNPIEERVFAARVGGWLCYRKEGAYWNIVYPMPSSGNDARYIPYPLHETTESAKLAASREIDGATDVRLFFIQLG